MASKPTTVADLAAEYRRLAEGAFRQAGMKIPKKNRADWLALGTGYRNCAEIAEAALGQDNKEQA